MQTIAIGDPGICHSVTRLHCANVADWIEIFFGVATLGDPGNSFLHRFDAAFTELL